MKDHWFLKTVIFFLEKEEEKRPQKKVFFGLCQDQQQNPAVNTGGISMGRVHICGC